MDFIFFLRQLLSFEESSSNRSHELTECHPGCAGGKPIFGLGGIIGGLGFTLAILTRCSVGGGALKPARRFFSRCQASLSCAFFFFFFKSFLPNEV